MIDTSFDFRTDTPPGKDPDSHSPALRRYHKLLWSKPLPSGIRFELVYSTPQVYLHHNSEIGEFWLSSDAVIPTFSREYKIRNIIDQIPSDQLDRFNTIGYTIGGMMLFPGHRVGRSMTINGALDFTQESRIGLTSQLNALNGTITGKGVRFTTPFNATPISLNCLKTSGDLSSSFFCKTSSNKSSMS